MDSLPAGGDFNKIDSLAETAHIHLLNMPVKVFAGKYLFSGEINDSDGLNELIYRKFNGKTILGRIGKQPAIKQLSG